MLLCAWLKPGQTITAAAMAPFTLRQPYTLWQAYRYPPCRPTGPACYQASLSQRCLSGPHHSARRTPPWRRLERAIWPPQLQARAPHTPRLRSTLPAAMAVPYGITPPAPHPSASAAAHVHVQQEDAANALQSRYVTASRPRRPVPPPPQLPPRVHRCTPKPRHRPSSSRPRHPVPPPQRLPCVHVQ